METSKTRIEPKRSRGGEWVVFGDEEYRVPPLAFRALQELADEVAGLQAMGAKPTVEQMTTIEKIVHSALSRNYPEMTLAEVSDMLDVGNYEKVLGAALSIAGFTRAKEGSPGETGASTGAGSTAP